MGNWLKFSLLALGLWGVWGFLGKVASQHLPARLVYLLTMAGCLAATGYTLIGGVGSFSGRPWAVGAALVSGIALAAGLRFFCEALARGPATVVVPITAVYPLVTVALCRVFLQETLSGTQMIGLACALASVWLLSR